MLEQTASEGTTPESAARASLSRTILRNTVMVSLGGGIIRIPMFLYTLYVVRALGDVAYGQYATVLAFTGLFAIFFELGATKYVERTIAQDHSRMRELFWQLLVVRLALSFVAVLVLTTAAAAIGYERIVVISVGLHALTYVFAALLTPFTAVFAAHERYDLWTAALIFGQVATMLLGALVLWLGYGLVGLMLVGLIAMPPQIALCAVMARRMWPGSLRIQLKLVDVPGFIRVSLPFGLTALALTVSYNADTFLLSLHYPSQVVGWYTAAYRLVPTIISILGGFLIVITPSLASRYRSEPEAVRVWVRNGIRGLALFGVPTAVGISILASQIVALLYGSSYEQSAVALTLLAWDVPLRLFNAFAGNVAAAVNLERISLGIFATGSISGLLLYLFAIPRFGIVGAATVTVIADGLTAVIFFLLLCRRLEASAVLAPLLLTALAALPMGALVWFAAPRAALPVTILAGAVTYGATALAFGLIDRSLLERATRRLQWR